MEKPTTTADVELTTTKGTENDTEQQQPKTEVKISFCTHVGWDGILVMLFLLILAGMCIFLTYSYTKFNSFDREFVWVFVLMACIFLSLVLYYLIRWKQMVVTFMEEEEAKSQEKKTEDQDAETCFQKAKEKYSDFQVFGKYYLLQLYTFEIVESINQIKNVYVVYTCSLPVGWVATICIALGIDCFHTFSFMIRENNPGRRDRQIIIDTCVDFACIILPLTLMWFGSYRVPISVEDMVEIVIIQAFTMLMKFVICLSKL